MSTPVLHRLQVARDQRQRIGVFGRPTGRTVELPWVGDAGAPVPEVRPDGLVARVCGWPFRR